jgi:hypothetical protein
LQLEFPIVVKEIRAALCRRNHQCGDDKAKCAHGPSCRSPLVSVPYSYPGIHTRMGKQRHFKKRPAPGPSAGGDGKPAEEDAGAPRRRGYADLIKESPLFEQYYKVGGVVGRFAAGGSCLLGRSLDRHRALYQKVNGRRLSPF